MTENAVKQRIENHDRDGDRKMSKMNNLWVVNKV